MVGCRPNGTMMMADSDMVRIIEWHIDSGLHDGIVCDDNKDDAPGFSSLRVINI